MIKVILWDIDGTLLNFEKAEKEAIRTCFSKFGLGECTDEMIARYSAINLSYWKRLERGEITKQEVLLGRFFEFFRHEQIFEKRKQNFSREGKHPAEQKCDFKKKAGAGEIFGSNQEPEELIAAFNGEYQVRLGDTIFFNDNGYELVKELKTRVKQYAVTNGTYIAQERKLRKSGLEELLDGAFISDKIGIEKPNPGFFEYVFEQIGPYKKDEVMIVGDSLTSDIRGGNNAGIVCCWYNPAGAGSHLCMEGEAGSLRIAYEIKDLQEIRDILSE